MSRSIFGWSYPAGCSGPPEPPDPCEESEQMAVLLERAECPQDVIDKACEIVDSLAAQLLTAQERECPYCVERAIKAEEEADREFERQFA